MKIEYGDWQWFQNNANKFDEWWDPGTFNWDFQGNLISHCSDNFDKWWDKDRINVTRHSRELASYCGDHFDKWWDNHLYDWHAWYAAESLARNCPQHFDKWFKKSKFPHAGNCALIKNCTNKFEEWYTPSRFRSMENINLLTQHCIDKLPIWFNVNYMTEQAQLKALEIYLKRDSLHDLKTEFIKLIPKKKQLKASLEWFNK